MVAGLLRWATLGFDGIYKTRSGLVARVALYLREAGYGIGSVSSCYGDHAEPTRLGPYAVLLVLGGTSPTDFLMARAEDFGLGIKNPPLGKHYTWKTVGATLFQGLGYPKAYGSPEILQTTFEDIYGTIQDHVAVSYILDEDESDWMKDVSVRFRWSEKLSGTPTARSIASIYFPTSADLVAPLYTTIATAGMLECVKNRSRRSACPSDCELEREIVQFRAITGSIVLALVGQLAGGDFETTQHCTKMDRQDESWIKGMCSVLDKSINNQSKMPIAHAIWLSAAIHAELVIDQDGITESTSRRPQSIVGYQSGIYTVLLSLLIHMEPTDRAVGLTFSATFFANLEPHRDGSIWGSSSSTIFPETGDQTHVAANTVTRSDGRWLGNPSLAPPDTELYTNFERSISSHDEPLLCLVGRVQGAPIAEVGIFEALRVILLSLKQPATRSHTDQDTQVVNVKASQWASNKLHKPVGTHEVPVFVPVQGNKAWTIFLAGQVAWLNPRIVFGCAQCAKDESAARYRAHRDHRFYRDNVVGDFSVLIGYSSR